MKRHYEIKKNALGQTPERMASIEPPTTVAEVIGRTEAATPKEKPEPRTAAKSAKKRNMAKSARKTPRKKSKQGRTLSPNGRAQHEIAKDTYAPTQTANKGAASPKH